MQEIILLRGIPGSGKTFWAKEFLFENTNFQRVNKDDIRKEFGLEIFSQENEKKVLEIERERGLKYLIEHKTNLIVDDTNFNPKHEEYWKGKAEELGIKFSIKDFNCPLKEAIERDSKRDNPVGESVIKRMYYQHVHKDDEIFTDTRLITRQNPNLPHCIICDIDGTLALINGRNVFDDTKCHTDMVNYNVLSILEKYDDTHSIILMSGRQEKAREVTEIWLKTHFIPFDELHMRETGDNRKDAIVKKELYERYIKDTYFVDFWLDDRNQVVDMVRKELGLLCLQVYYGDF